MADHERLMKIINALVAHTTSGEAEWDRAFAETYATKSGEYELRISSEDGDGAPPYKFSIHDASHIELDALSMDEGDLLDDEEARVADTLHHLFELARRDALGVDDAITSVERNLGIV